MTLPGHPPGILLGSPHDVVVGTAPKISQDSPRNSFWNLSRNARIPSGIAIRISLGIVAEIPQIFSLTISQINALESP